jgi:hypothetical protein
MKPFTYRDLFVALCALTVDEFEMSASVLIDGEVYGIMDTMLASELDLNHYSDVLDVVEGNQPLLII